MRIGDLVKTKTPCVSTLGQEGWSLLDSDGINYLILNLCYTEYIEYAEILPGEWVNTKDLELVD